jgi:MoaA/NifB/PqqE/SkfB family radical SAM enzyme
MLIRFGPVRLTERIILMTSAATVARATAARLRIRPAPIGLTFELTHRCNLACGYCDRHKPMPNEMTRKQILRALAQFIEMGMQRINLDGGEPLAHRYVEEIVDWLVERGVSVRMNTNGILVPRKIETVRKLNRVKISLDGPRESHDVMRGQGAFDKAIAGALAAREAGVKVEFTCTVGRHNGKSLDALLDLVEELGFAVMFQPARNSLFLETDRDGSLFQLEAAAHRAAFARIEQRKRTSKAVANAWSSLRHFRAFPEEKAIPCNAGWMAATMDPEGNLYHCGDVNRSDRSNNVARLGAALAFTQLRRVGCRQCWCARTVEGNYKWAGRFDMLLPPLPSRTTVPSIKDPAILRFADSAARTRTCRKG